MKVKEFTDMLGSFNSIVISVEKEGTVIAFDEISKNINGFYDLSVNLKLASKKVKYSIAEINAMDIVGITTATNGHEVRIWLDV